MRCWDADSWHWQVKSSQEASPFVNTPGPFTLGCCQAARDLSIRQLHYCNLLHVCGRSHDLVCIGSVQLHVQPSAAKLAWVIGSCWRGADVMRSMKTLSSSRMLCQRSYWLHGFMKLIGTNMEAEGKCSRRGRMTSHGIAPHSVTWQHAKAAKATRASPKNNALRHWQRIDRVLQYIALAKSCQFSKLPNLSVAMLAASAASSFAFRRPAPWLLGLPWQVSMN